MKAFVLDRGIRQDVSDARRFGELKFLFEKGESPPIWSSKFVKEATQRLADKGFFCETDFLVVTGNIAGYVLLVAHLLRVEKLERLNLLLFDSAQEEYIHKVIL